MITDPTALMLFVATIGFIAGALMVYLLAKLPKAGHTAEADDLAATIRGQRIRHVHHFPGPVAGTTYLYKMECLRDYQYDRDAWRPYEWVDQAVMRVTRLDPEAVIVLEPKP